MLSAFTILHLNHHQLLDLQIPLEWLSYFVTFFLGAIAVLLCYIGIYIIRELRRKKLRGHLVTIFSNFIGDIVLCETEEDLHAAIRQPYVQTIMRRWLTLPIGRQVLIGQLVQNHKSLAGVAGDNLIWLYNHFGLYKDSLAALTSSEWYRKASAMQQLAEMQQKQYLGRLYRDTNAGIHLVRAEAQIAVVKLTGFSGLRFLNVISRPVTQWQQLCLLNQLPPPEEMHYENIRQWLSSRNDTVVEFTLRLVSKFQLILFHDAAAECLTHQNEVVRKQAVDTLRIIAAEETPDVFISRFPAMSHREQLQVLLVLEEIGSVNHLPFLDLVSAKCSGINKKAAERSAAAIRLSAGDYDGNSSDTSGEKNLMVVA